MTVTIDIAVNGNVEGDRAEVEVDGALAQTVPAGTSASLTPSGYGPHGWIIRAVHGDGAPDASTPEALCVVVPAEVRDALATYARELGESLDEAAGDVLREWAIAERAEGDQDGP